MSRTVTSRFLRKNTCALGLILSCAVALMSCSDEDPPKGQLMVAVQTDMSIPKDVDSIRVEISAYGNLLFSNDYDVGPSALLIPATLALIAGEDPTPVRIRVSARQKGRLRVLREAITTVPRDRIATLRMPIEWLCDGQVWETDTGEVESRCADGQTCVAGLCDSSQVDSDSLETYDSGRVFGGGMGTGDGTCFDTVACFSEGAGVAVRVSGDGTCGFEKPQGAENINLALVLMPGSDGICGPEACLIPLDAGGESGWYEDDGRILLPRAVCDRIEDDKNRVVGLALTTSCETKTESIPTCGPWSSVTTNPGQFDAGPPDVMELRDAGPEVDAQPEAEPDVVIEAEPDVVAEAEPDVVIEAEPDVIIEAEPDVIIDVVPDVKPQPGEVCPGTEMTLDEFFEGSITGDTSSFSSANSSAYSSSICATQGTAQGKQFIVKVTPESGGHMMCWVNDQKTIWSSALYVRSDCEDASSEIVCNNSYDEEIQRIEFIAQKGEPYYLFVDGNGLGEEGSFALHCYLWEIECRENEMVSPQGLCMAKSVTMPGGWAIDATQVTFGQYMQWYDTIPSPGGQSSFCDWNDSFEPDGEMPSYDDPVTRVDWCDAYAYCEAIGKRLCGKIGGGKNELGDYADASSSQWFAACSSGGTNAYPYGDTYDVGMCNGIDTGLEEASEVGSFQGCQSSAPGFEGVFDLSGNVWEWEDSCEDLWGEEDDCRLRGGSMLEGEQGLRCDSDKVIGRSEREYDIGFRCCSY